MVDTASIKAALAKVHNDKARAVNNSHVVSVWEDGEVTMTKSGDLYGSRREIVINDGGDKMLPPDLFPMINPDGKHGRVQCTYENMPKVRALVLELIASFHTPVEEEAAS